MFISLLTQDPLFYAMIIGSVIVSVCLHEFAHALAATAQGDDTAKKAGFLSLNPWVLMGPYSLLFLAFAGIAWGVTPTNPSKFRSGKLGETFVAFSGPFMNVVLMVLCVTGMVLMGPARLVDPDWSVLLLKVGGQINAVLFLFNMLPIPPLDGYAIWSPWLPFLRKHEHSLSQYGFFVLIVLFFVFKLGARLFDVGAEMNRWLYIQLSVLLS